MNYLKCLSVRQPWAWLLVNGFKDIENRSWKTRYRGPLLIHASKVPNLTNLTWCRDPENLYAKVHGYQAKVPALADIPLGAIVGRVTLVDCNMKYTSKWYTPGSWGWHVTDAQVFPTPIPYQGRQGLFNVPKTLLAGMGGVGE